MSILDGVSNEASLLTNPNIVDQDSTSLRNLPSEPARFPAAAVTANDTQAAVKVTDRQVWARTQANNINVGKNPNVAGGSITRGF